MSHGHDDKGMDWGWLGLYDIGTPEGMAQAQEWTRNLISIVIDGGIWVVPRSGAVIKLDKKKRIATVSLAVRPDPAIVKVLEAMGWTVENRDALLG